MLSLKKIHFKLEKNSLKYKETHQTLPEIEQWKGYQSG